MCASCGCQKWEDSHGDQRNITLNELRQAADAAGVDMQRVVENLKQAAGMSAARSGPTGGRQH